MTHNRRPGHRPAGLALTRRAALATSLTLLSGCGLWDDWFGTEKPPLPGTRIPVMARRRGLDVDKAAVRQVVLPPQALNADWPQAGGVPSHDMEHPAMAPSVAVAWTADIGAGGGFREKLTAQPVIAGGRVFTMDSNAVVSAFDAGTGRRIWELDTQAEDDRSSNVGGGISADGDRLYAATGRGDLLAIEAATGKILWRINFGIAARSAPTIAEGKVFVATLDNQLLARSADDGKALWSYRAGTSDTQMLGLPAPAYADGLVVAGFGSGDLITLRANSGTVAWADSLAATRGRNSLSDLSAICGRPVIKDGAVYTIGLGGLMVASDLRSGRRLWEREVASSETPWIAGAWLFVVSQDAQVAALARDDGAVAWVTQLDRFEDMEKNKDPIRWVGPTLAGERLVVAGSNEIAFSLNPITGQIIGQQGLSAPAALAPVVAGGTLFMLTDNATLTAFR